jgi:methyl-accepting chemotaxis protein
MFKNMKLAVKMTVGFAVIVVIAAVMAVIGLLGMSKMNAADSAVADIKVPAIVGVMNMNEAFSYIIAVERGMLNRRMTSSAQDRQSFMEKEKQGIDKFEKNWKVYEPLEKTKTEAELWKQFVPAYTEWKATHDKFMGGVRDKFALLDAGAAETDPRVTAFDDQLLAIHQEGTKQWRNADSFLGSVVNDNVDSAGVLAKEFDKTYGDSKLLVILAFIFGLVLSVGMSVFLSNNIGNILKTMINETLMLVDAAVAGKLSTRADEMKIDAEFRPVATGVNKVLDAVIGPLNVAADYVDRISKGNIPEKITDNYNGDFNKIKNNLNKCVDSVNALVRDAGMLSQAAFDGRLMTRADGSLHEGDFRKIVEGVNKTLDLVILPINEASGCLKEMAKGNLDVWVNGDYKGDLGVIKDSLNSTIASISDILSQVAVAVDQVSSGSSQVSSSSQALAQSSNEAASSLEEITSSMQELASQTKQNAENATQANNLALNARTSAEKGAGQMKEMDTAMKEISESSANVSKIMKVIDEIAFQTNLLALNAAVEAARAGKHGKGFTVVAEEVRNLAQRSAKAAKETAELIEGSIKKTEAGTRISEDTSKSLGEIVVGATKVTDLIGEIASASKEQTLGIGQINQGLTQMDQVTQQNSASAEESASASEELSGQAVQLKQMISKFKLSNKYAMAAKPAAYGTGYAAVQKEAPRTVGRDGGNGGAKRAKASEIIALDDNTFDKF